MNGEGLNEGRGYVSYKLDWLEPARMRCEIGGLLSIMLAHRAGEKMMEHGRLTGTND